MGRKPNRLTNMRTLRKEIFLGSILLPSFSSAAGRLEPEISPLPPGGV
jgi:hypothetical protein